MLTSLYTIEYIDSVIYNIIVRSSRVLVCSVFIRALLSRDLFNEPEHNRVRYRCEKKQNIPRYCRTRPHTKDDTPLFVGLLFSFRARD